MFASFMPIIGSPPRGYNAPPTRGAAPFLGIWGRADTTIPPLANPYVQGHPGDADVAIDTVWKGFFYTTAAAVMRTWATHNGCAHAATQPPSADGCAGSGACAIGTSAGATCDGYSDGCDGGAPVLRCLHDGGHVAPPWAPAALYAFMCEQDGVRTNHSMHMASSNRDISSLAIPTALAVIGAAALVATACALVLLHARRRRNRPRRPAGSMPRELSLGRVMEGHQPTGSRREVQELPKASSLPPA